MLDPDRSPDPLKIKKHFGKQGPELSGHSFTPPPPLREKGREKVKKFKRCHHIFKLSYGLIYPGLKIPLLMIIIIINYLQSSSISPSLQFPGPFVCCSNLSTAREPLLHHPGHQKVTELQNILKLKYSKYPGYPYFCTTPAHKRNYRFAKYPFTKIF